MIEPKALEEALRAAFPDGDIVVRDLTGTKDHYEASITSAGFRDKSLIAQHQLVYQALGEAMNGPIHALALKTAAK